MVKLYNSLLDETGSNRYVIFVSHSYILFDECEEIIRITMH